MLKPVLIGQAPGPATDPDLPLWPYPSHKSGGRLCAMMGIDPERYVELFDRTNLICEHPGRERRDDRFPVPWARNAAHALTPLLRGRHVILVGRKVAEAFGVETEFYRWEMFRGFTTATVPHPSGRNRLFNSPESLDEARRFWRDFFTAERRSS